MKKFEYYVSNPNDFSVQVAEKFVRAQQTEIVRISHEHALELKDKGWRPSRRYSDIEHDMSNLGTGSGGPTSIGYGVSIYKADGVEVGSYYAERLVQNTTTLNTFYAEIISGTPSSQISVYLEVNGALALGPFTVTNGSPLQVNENITVLSSNSVGFVVVNASGVTDFFAKVYGSTV